ncbi:MAG: peroxiredoxin [Candidatus Poseidoniia archaeon]|nr:peroxiredoxin [Candidatus Poseidoniia archaeon]
MAPTIPRIGKSAPLFEGEIVRYDSRKKEILYDKISLVNIIEDNQWTVLFFYPRDFSRLCPTEIHSFNRRVKDFQKANCVLIGCSTDSRNSHKAWMERPRTKGGIDKLSYPLLADPSLKITSAYGVLEKSAGLALRGTFIIDDQGYLRSLTVNPPSIGRSVDETVRTLQALQSGKSCPAGWRPGRKTL